MIKRSIAGLCAATLVSLAALPAVAVAKPLSATAALKALDPDKDGTLDWAEVKQAAEAKFDSLEKDKDGTLDLKELKGLGIGPATLKKADPDKDGTLDKAEFVAIAEARFKAANPDGDGTLDLKELRSKAGKALLLLLK